MAGPFTVTTNANPKKSKKIRRNQGLRVLCVLRVVHFLGSDFDFLLRDGWFGLVSVRYCVYS